MSVHAVVWDMDGTLLDSEPLHDETMMAVTGRLGYALSAEELEGFLGLGTEECFRRMAARHRFSVDFAGFNAELNRYYAANAAAKVRPRPGARETVLALAERGVPQACASNSDRPIVQANLAVLGVDSALGAAVAGTDVARVKPAPDVFLRACALLGVAPTETVAVEDTPTGIAAARAAGCTTVAWPQARGAHLDFSHAHHVIQDIAAFFRGELGVG